MFNENFPSLYETQPVTENECKFFTLPVVDGYNWSRPKQPLAGLRLKATIEGKDVSLEGVDPVFTPMGTSSMRVSWSLKQVLARVEIELAEKKMTVQIKSPQKIDWFFDLTTADNIVLPFSAVKSKNIACTFEGMSYTVQLKKGFISQPGNGVALRIHPQKNSISINF
jgi:hypothetical protein